MHQIAGFLVALVLIGIQPGRAQEAADNVAPRLTAFACGVLPQPLRVDVQVMDNSEQQLRYRDTFVARLHKSGVEVASGAPLLLTLDVRKVVEFDRGEGGDLFELRAGPENEDIGREGDLFMRGNVWSNHGNSVLGGRKRGPGQLSTDQLQVTASVNRRDNGRCLWQGEVRYNLKGDDADEAAQRIMPILAGALGKTVRDKPVRIVR